MMSAFVEKAKEYLSNATGAAFRQEWELFDKECEAFSAHLEAREAVTTQLAEALKRQVAAFDGQAIGDIEFWRGFDTAQRIEDGRAALQSYDEASNEDL